MPSATPPNLHFPPETMPVRCPRCGASASAQVTTIVDATDVRARDSLLDGRLNRATCPACQLGFRAAVPLLYHDASKDAAYVFVPGGLQSNQADQERAVGRLTNRLMEQLPAQDRRMYLLQPKVFVSDSSFMSAVLEANGISPETAAKARETAQLVQQLADTPDEASLRGLLDAAGRKADDELLLFVRSMAEQLNGQGAVVQAERLARLMERLLALGEYRRVKVDDILESLQAAAKAGQLVEAVAELRAFLDYGFFSALTQRMDDAEAEGNTQRTEALRTLRADLVAAVDEVDAAARAEIEGAANTLRAVLAAPDPLAALRERASALGEAFFMVIEANLQAADQDGRADLVARLGTVYEAALAVYEENLPPLARLVNHLARTADAAARETLLDASPELVTAELLALLIESTAAAGSAGATPVAEALRLAADAVQARLAAAGRTPRVAVA